MIDFKIISMVSKGLPWRQMTNSAPCGSLQKLIMSPSNYVIIYLDYVKPSPCVLRSHRPMATFFFSWVSGAERADTQ